MENNENLENALKMLMKRKDEELEYGKFLKELEEVENAEKKKMKKIDEDVKKSFVNKYIPFKSFKTNSKDASTHIQKLQYSGPNYTGKIKSLNDLYKEIHTANEISRILNGMIKLKWIIKKAIFKWRGFVKERKTPKNDTDLYDFSPIKSFDLKNIIKVYENGNVWWFTVYDISNIYGKSLSHDMEGFLNGMNDPPKNPYHNTPFTLTQNIEIYSQMVEKRKAYTPMIFHVFKKCHFDMRIYEKHGYDILRFVLKDNTLDEFNLIDIYNDIDKIVKKYSTIHDDAYELYEMVDWILFKYLTISNNLKNTSLEKCIKKELLQFVKVWYKYDGLQTEILITENNFFKKLKQTLSKFKLVNHHIRIGKIVNNEVRCIFASINYLKKLKKKNIEYFNWTKIHDNMSKESINLLLPVKKNLMFFEDVQNDDKISLTNLLLSSDDDSSEDYIKKKK